MENVNKQLLDAAKQAKHALDLYKAYGWADRNGVIGKLELSIAAAEQEQQAEPGMYAILYRDNWDGEGDTYYLIARLDENGKWTADKSGARLMTYEGDAILRVWPLADDKAPQKAVPVGWRVAIPGRRHTDKWDSARVSDYNDGWNDYQKAVKSALAKLEGRTE